MNRQRLGMHKLLGVRVCPSFIMNAAKKHNLLARRKYDRKINFTLFFGLRLHEARKIFFRFPMKNIKKI